MEHVFRYWSDSFLCFYTYQTVLLEIIFFLFLIELIVSKIDIQFSSKRKKKISRYSTNEI